MTTNQTKSAEVEACNYSGTDYVGMSVSPRGFANEHTIFVVPADKAATLQPKMDRNDNREAGDGYRARWLTRQELAQHIFAARESETGWAYLVTVDENGNPDSLRI